MTKSLNEQNKMGVQNKLYAFCSVIDHFCEVQLRSAAELFSQGDYLQQIRGRTYLRYCWDNTVTPILGKQA